MAVFWKLIRKEIRQKPARFLILALGMTAAVFLITVMTIFSTSCLQAMIRQEIEEKRRQSEEGYKKYFSLYLKLGFLAGLMLSILIA